MHVSDTKCCGHKSFTPFEATPRNAKDVAETRNIADLEAIAVIAIIALTAEVLFLLCPLTRETVAYRVFYLLPV